MRRWAVLYLLLLTIMTGCTSPSLDIPKEQADSINSEKMTGDETMDPFDMTESEKELLAAVYPNESQIREGILFEYQKEGLRLLRAGKTYLDEKYSEYEVSLLSFEPANKFTPWAVLRFQCGDSEICKAFVTPKDGDYDCTDTFYGVLLQPEYDNMIMEILSKKGILVRSFTKFLNPIGKELGKGAGVDDLLAIAPKLPRNTHLFITGDLDQTVADTIELILREEGMYGAYTLYFTGNTENSNVSIDRLESEHSNYTRLSFNCFDEA